MKPWPNHALQRTRPSRSGCSPRLPRAGVAELGSLENSETYMNTCRFNICLIVAFAVTAVAQSPSSSVANLLFSERNYPVDPGPFFRLLRKAINEKEIHSDVEALQMYFKQNQIDLTPPSSVKFRKETKSVVVTSTAENLAKVEALLPPPPPAAPVLFTRCFALGTNNFEVLRYSLNDNGIEFSPPSMLFYTHGENTLMVRSTKENLEAIKRLLGQPHSAK